MFLCNVCYIETVYIKKRGVCYNCYCKGRKEGKYQDKVLTVGAFRHFSEVAFANNYFTHENWYHEPAQFKLKGTLYRPDFYDGENNVFIEVSASIAKYDQNREKYIMFRKMFPKICLEIRNVAGELIDETKSHREIQYIIDKGVTTFKDVDLKEIKNKAVLKKKMS